MTIPTYRDLEDRIVYLEEQLSYWSGLASFFDDLPKVLEHPPEWDETPADSIKQGLKEAIDYEPEFGKLGPVWDDERMDIVGQNGNDGLHYNEDKEGM